MSTPRQKPACEALLIWLRNNLGGKGSLAALTGTDAKALTAAVHIVELMTYGGSVESLAGAFGAVVRLMQPKTQYLAFHAIAFVMDWDDRARIWVAAGLPEKVMGPECAFAPGGEMRKVAS